MKMKKVLSLALAAAMALSLAACGNGGGGASSGQPSCGASSSGPSGGASSSTPAPAPTGELITVGVINNDPNESGYRTANDKAMRDTFTADNGYEATFYNNNDAAQQIATAQQMIQDEVDFLLLSPASTTGWDTVLKDAQDAGTQVILFDRMLEADESMYAAAVVWKLTRACMPPPSSPTCPPRARPPWIGWPPRTWTSTTSSTFRATWVPTPSWAVPARWTRR